MPYRLLFFALLALLAGSPAGGAAAQAAPAAADSVASIPEGHVGHVKLFILAGQSNMSGRGEVPEVQEGHPRVFVFGNDYRWHPGKEPVDGPQGQVDPVSLDAGAGFGPGLSFGVDLAAAYPDDVIGLIPCAMGATIIEEWQRNLRDDTLYGSCLKRALAASPMGTLEGLLFFQGESDAHHGAEYHGVPRRPHQWGDKFTAFVEAMRADLREPGLPVVFAQIGPHTSPERYVNWEVVQEQQASVRLPYTAMITTGDLSLRDRVHYDTPSYRVIGARFAEAMQGLLPPAMDLQGHRGARGLVPENTWPSFERALSLGVTTLELDVVLSKDGEVVVSHEPWFNHSICTKPDGSPITEAEEESLNIYEMTYEEVARYDCGSLGNPRFPEQVAQPVAKPRLAEVLEKAEAYAARTGRPAVRYNVEIKSRPTFDDLYHPVPAVFSERVHSVIREAGLLERATIQSFDPRVLDAVHAIDAALTTALLVDNDDGFEANLARLNYTPRIYSPHQRLVDAALVAAVHDRGMRVVPWTVNEPEDMNALLDLGVDGLITDYPDRAQRVLAER